MDELTKDWLDVFDQGKRDGELATSPFFRLVPLIGLPNGVDDTHPRVIAAIGDIQRAVEGAK